MLFAAAKLKCRVYIDGVYVPCDIVKVNYPVNGIPTCTLRLVPGHELRTLSISTAHGLKGLVYQIPLQIFLDIEETSGIYPQQFAPVGTYLLFDGYVSNVQYSRDVTALHIFVEGLHWLYDLAFSSALSDAFHPTTPVDVTFNAFLNSRSGSMGALIAVDDSAFALTPQIILYDVWYALWTILYRIASIDRFAYQFFPYRINDSPNRATARALRRFVFGMPPLTISPVGIDPLMIAYNIITMLTHASVDYNPLSLATLAETTLWERLTEVLAPIFQFAVIPFPTYARVVPYTPTLPYPYTIITPNAIFTITRTNDVTKPYHAMVLVSNMRLPGGADLLSDPERANTVGFGGVYSSLNEGMTFFRHAPPYAVYLAVLPMLLAADALNPWNRGNGYAFPGLKPPNWYTYNFQTINYYQRYLLDRMAQYYFTMELLKGKRMLITGPLRFDICPGSIVHLTSLGEKFYNVIRTDYQTSVTGFVSNVRFVLRATQNSALASTVLELAFVRDGMQNSHPDFTVPGHPLYQTYFTGDHFIYPL